MALVCKAHKTRSGAARLIEACKVRINSDRALRSSRLIQTGDVVTLAFLGRLSVGRGLGQVDRRGQASLARTRYEDLTPQTLPEADSASRHGPRPAKWDRRGLDALRSRAALTSEVRLPCGKNGAGPFGDGNEIGRRE